MLQINGVRPKESLGFAWGFQILNGGTLEENSMCIFNKTASNKHYEAIPTTASLPRPHHSRDRSHTYLARGRVQMVHGPIFTFKCSLYKIPLHNPFKLCNNFQSGCWDVWDIYRFFKGKIPEKFCPLTQWVRNYWYLRFKIRMFLQGVNRSMMQLSFQLFKQDNSRKCMRLFQGEKKSKNHLGS